MHISIALEQKTANFKVACFSRAMQWSVLAATKIISILEAISITNQIANYRSAVTVHGRLPNVGSVFNAGGSSSLHTTMNAAARLIQLPAAMRSNAPQNQPLFAAARVKHREDASSGRTSAAHSTAARRCSRTCTLLTRPRVTRSITTSAQLHDMRAI